MPAADGGREDLRIPAFERKGEEGSITRLEFRLACVEDRMARLTRLGLEPQPNLLLARHELLGALAERHSREADLPKEAASRVDD